MGVVVRMLFLSAFVVAASGGAIWRLVDSLIRKAAVKWVTR